MTERRRAIRAVLAIAEEARGRTATMGVDVDEHGRAHLKGGYWASTPERVIYCYTLENAQTVQAILAKLAGWPCDEQHPETKDKRGRRRVCLCKACVAIRHSIDDYCTLEKAEGELAQAIAEPATYGADKSAERMRRARAKARAAGRCLVCRIEPARDGRKTCAQCSYNACVRVARMREAC